MYATNKRHLINLFKLYWNSFLTVAYFAEHFGISEKRAYKIINTGRKLHNKQADKLRAAK